MVWNFFLYICRDKNIFGTMKKHNLILMLIAVAAVLSCSTKERIQGAPFLPVEGIVNARDLGGYPAADGRTVRSGILFRAASLADATDADLDYLARIPVKEVIDFRMDFELKGRADRMAPGAEYVRIPVNSSAGSKLDDDESTRKMKERKHFDINKVIMIAAFHEKAQALAQELYPNMVFHPECQQQFAAFLQEVVAADGGAVLFHCTQGKDRTGLASAFLLSALGVDREHIVADFDITNRVYEKQVKRLSRRVRLFGGKEPELAVIQSLIGANTENFIKTLDQIDATYGSMTEYLTGPLGLSQEDIRTLKDKYLQ